MFKKKFKVEKITGSWEYWAVKFKKSIFHSWKLVGLYGEKEEAEKHLNESL